MIGIPYQMNFFLSESELANVLGEDVVEVTKVDGRNNKQVQGDKASGIGSTPMYKRPITFSNSMIGSASQQERVKQ